MEYDYRVGFVMRTLEEEVDRYVNVIVKMWTLLNSREILKNFEVEDQYKQAEL